MKNYKETFNDWLNLAKSLLSVFLFNRRKSDELEHVFIEDYEKYESLNEIIILIHCYSC